MVKKNADPYQPTSCSEWNWVVMAGIAVAMIVMSRATRKMLMTMATRIGISFAMLGYMLLSTGSRGPPSSPDGGCSFSRLPLLLWMEFVVLLAMGVGAAVEASSKPASFSLNSSPSVDMAVVSSC